jgi:hypothetical protein
MNRRILYNTTLAIELFNHRLEALAEHRCRRRLQNPLVHFEAEM